MILMFFYGYPLKISSERLAQAQKKHADLKPNKAGRNNYHKYTDIFVQL